MTFLDHCRRAMLTEAQKKDVPERSYGFQRLDKQPPTLDWRDDRDFEAVDSQLDALIPLPEPEPAQRDLFK